jgi:Ca2+-binding EF-hand superfamily protein
MPKIIYPLIGLAVIAGTSSSFAQDNTGDVFKNLLEKFDKNGDGKLDDEEREAARAALIKQAPQGDPEVRPIRERRTPSQIARDRRRAEFDARRRQFELLYDKNKDGELSDEEREALREEFRKRGEQRRQEFMERYDKNGDGDIDDSEREAIRADREKRRDEFMKKWDKDGNGDIDEKEREAIRESFRKRREEATAKYDENKDGILSFEEMDKAREDGAFEGGGGFPFPLFGGFGGPISGRGGPGRPRGDGDRRR